MEYHTHITPAKEQAVKEIHDEFEQYNGYIFTDYRGVTVEQITDIRRELRKSDAAYRVVKNRFAQIAMKELGHEGLDDKLVGPTAIALAKGDTSNEVAKVLFNAAKGGTPLKVRGAYIDGEYYDEKAIEALSKLPTKLELISSLMGTMKAPVQKLAATLLAYVEKNSENAAN